MIRSQLERLAEGLEDGPPPTLPVPSSALGSTRTRRGGQSQGAVILGVRVHAGTPERRRALAVLASLLDSQSGRLFMDLREARGLAYGVWATAQVSSVLPEGVLSLGLTMSPERASEARDALVASWRLLLGHGVTVQEVDRTTRMLAGHAAMARERVAGRARAAVHHIVGGQPLELKAFQDGLRGVDPSVLGSVLEELRAAPVRVAMALPREEP